jgi:hypothetical protein
MTRSVFKVGGSYLQNGQTANWIYSYCKRHNNCNGNTQVKVDKRQRVTMPILDELYKVSFSLTPVQTANQVNLPKALTSSCK